MTNDDTVEVIAKAMRSLPDAVLVRLVLAGLANTDLTPSQIAGTQAGMQADRQVGTQAMPARKHYGPRRRYKPRKPITSEMLNDIRTGLHAGTSRTTLAKRVGISKLRLDKIISLHRLEQ